MKKEDAYKLGVGQTQFRKKFKRKKRLKRVRDFILWSLLLTNLFSAVFFTCIKITRCLDDGMNGSINQWDYVITDRLSFSLREPKRGEIITCTIKDSSGVEKCLQRRIIAFPGETVEIRGGTLTIDGRPCKESYASGITESEVATVIVPPGTYYVLSDARETGPDSRNGIYVTADSITGAVIMNFSIPSSPEEFFTKLIDRFAGYI